MSSPDHKCTITWTPALRPVLPKWNLWKPKPDWKRFSYLTVCFVAEIFLELIILKNECKDWVLLSLPCNLSDLILQYSCKGNKSLKTALLTNIFRYSNKNLSSNTFISNFWLYHIFSESCDTFLSSEYTSLWGRGGRKIHRYPCMLRTWL